MKSIYLMATTAALMISGCTQKVDAQSSANGQSTALADGRPYELKGTEVWSVPDTARGRSYEVFVSLPSGYKDNPTKRYPVIYVADADYAFPLIRSIARRLNVEGPTVEEFILVGLSYAQSDTPVASRRLDYTPTSNGPADVTKDQPHGGAAAYQAYLKQQALPFVEKKYRTDTNRKIFMGHSYGALLGTHILFTDPAMFQDYILGSPSLWFDKKVMFQREEAFAASHKDLPANIFMYVGAFETLKSGDARYNKTADLVGDMAALEAKLKSRGYPSLKIRSTVLSDENHVSVFPRGFTRGLEYLLPAKPPQK